MKSVLILTYYWPPAGGPGVQRWLKFVKYFHQLGWEAVVLTVENGTYSAIDPELEKEVSEGLKVFKTKSRDPFRYYNMLKGKKDKAVSVALINIDQKRSLIDRLSMYIRSNFFIPDGRKGWVPYAYREALRIMKDRHIDLLVTTGPPHSTHLTGLRLKKKLGIKWLADLRDPWTNVYYNDMLPRSARTRRIDREFEDAVLKNADALSVVSPGMQKEFSDRNENVHVVMNGFDLTDMDAGTTDRFREPSFRLTYTGNFKPNQHVPQLWEAICELAAEDPGFRKDFRLCFVGNTDDAVMQFFRAGKMEDVLELIPYVPHAEVTAIMKASDILLFVVPQSRNNRLIITGKLFEYLASGSPVISAGPTDGDAAGIIRKTGRLPMLDYNDKAGFKESLLNLYKQWKSPEGSLAQLDTAMLQAYSREASAGQITALMDKITASS